MLMFAGWKGVTSFDTECVMGISCNPSLSKSHKEQWAAKLSAVFVTICVDRIGDGLRSLTIREMPSPIVFGIENLRSIGEGCPNVETIKFVFEAEVFEYRPFDNRFDSFPRLKTLTVSVAGGDFARASASVFLSIPTSIEVIRGLSGIEEEPFENAAQIEGFFADRPSLREVNLDDLYTRDGSKGDIFRVIAERCPHLKSINLPYYCYDPIDDRGVVALESMKKLCLPSSFFDEMQIVTICERSPLVEALELNLIFSFNLHLQSVPLNALGALTKLAELSLWISRSSSSHSTDVVAPSLVTEFVRQLARNSGASLRRLCLDNYMRLPTAAIEALANGCGKLRYVEFWVCFGEATPASIRFLIDCIVAHPSWIHQSGEGTLVIALYVIDDGVDEDEAEAGMTAFKALAEPAANLPAGVDLIIDYSYAHIQFEG